MKQRDHYRQILGLVHKIGRLVNPQHLPGLRERQLSLSHFLVLDALAESASSLRMTELAAQSGLKATELSRVVASLEEREWLTRSADGLDSRAKQVRLTPAGTRGIERVRVEATAELSAVWEDFTHDEWHRFIDLLQRFERGVRRVRLSPRQTDPALTTGKSQSAESAPKTKRPRPKRQTKGAAKESNS